jgi:hypothetical protein
MEIFLTGPNRYVITWNEEDVSGAATLLRSEHPHEGWKEVADVTGLFQYVDIPASRGEELRKRRFREWYYRIDSKAGTAGPMSLDGKPDRRALQVSRLAWRHLARDIQTQAYLLPRSTTGERCEVCWDETRQQVTRTNCPECDGTGFQEGYPSPVLIYVSFDNQEVHPEDFPNMKFEQGQHQMWTASEPRIQAGDYIVRKRDLQIYEIVRVQPTSKAGLVIRQPMIGRVVPKSDVRSHMLDDLPSRAVRDYINGWSYWGTTSAPFCDSGGWDAAVFAA